MKKTANDTVPSLRTGRRKGFTLIELMAVIVVMAILGSIILGIAGFAGRKAAESKAIGDLQKIRGILTDYQIKFGTYPLGDVANLAEWNAIGPDLTNSVQVEINFDDPWGRAYQYRALRRTGQTGGRVMSYDLWSYGPSGGPGDVRQGEDWEYDVIR